MKLAIILIYAAVTLFNIFLILLSYRHRNAPIPENVQDVYDEETYKKRMAYVMEHTRLNIASSLVSLAVFVIVMTLNLHSAFFNAITPHISNYYIQTFLLFAMLTAIGIPFNIISSAIATFKVEAKYGFNRTSAGTFVVDLIKRYVIMGAAAFGVLSLFLIMYDWLGNWVFVAFVGTLLILILLLRFFMRFIIRIHYKLTPLEEGSLRDKIAKLGKETDFDLKNIFVVNASRRTTKQNAMFTGFGKTKTIMLYDNLVNNYEDEEILSILAHEIGHAKHKHGFVTIPLQALSFGILTAVAFFAVNSTELSHAFGFSEINVGFSLSAVAVAVSPLMLIFGLLRNAVSRKHEFQADDYAVRHVGVEPSLSVEKKLARDNFGNLTPHPLIVAVHYTHPPVSARVANIEQKGEKYRNEAQNH